MKRVLLMCVMLGAVSAVADIPLPTDRNVSTKTYDGKEAKAKYKSILGESVGGYTSGWTGKSVSFKVERSEDGLAQTVCEKHTNFRNPRIKPTYTCTDSVSQNGKPLPVFKAPHRVG